VYSDHPPSPLLQAIFEGAKRFGLSEEEAWWAIDECLSEVGMDAMISEYLDELTGALAQRILSKQRGIPSEELF
jgi:ABC-type Mn2+/Zn2+ transport system ATPase subunit